MKTIGWNEEFLMFVLVDHKLADYMESAIKSGGFQVSRMNMKSTDDVKLSITVHPCTAYLATMVIDVVLNEK